MRHFLVCEYEHLWKSILTESNLKYTEKDATAIRMHCHNHCHTADTSCFSLVKDAANKLHLKLKESLLIFASAIYFLINKTDYVLETFQSGKKSVCYYILYFYSSADL